MSTSQPAKPECPDARPLAVADNLEESEILQAGYRYALALARHHQDAEDLVQQGWLRLYRRYGGVSRLPLLFTTIRNLFFDQRTRHTRLPLVSLEDLEEAELGEDDGEAIAALAQVEVERLLSRLNPREREVLFFHYVHGYTAAEIGGLTTQPRGTVLSLLQRARHKLLRFLKTPVLSCDETPADPR